MAENKKTPYFFLGVNSPKGYYSLFDREIESRTGGRCWLLKGGPGTGKSTVLKKLASALSEIGMDAEQIRCSADTDSLDAVISEDGSFAAFDATPPHAYEPKFPGAYETTLSLSDCWDENLLRSSSEKIIALFKKNSALHEKAGKYISAAAALYEEVFRLADEFLKKDKTVKTALRICAREFKRKHHTGKENIRFLSAVTDKGVFVCDETPKMLCEKIYVIEDDYGAASRLFMNTVRKAALECGYDIITCRCAIFPAEKNEHIFIPELKLGFMTSNRRHPIEAEPFRMIHSRRFMDEKELMKHKIRIRFTLKVASQLISEASEYMKEAKRVHDELEALYIPAMDFPLVEKKLAEIISEINN